MATQTRFVFLMHPKEFKEEKAGTGRLTQLCLPNSELHMGLKFDEHPVVRGLLADPHSFPVLLYPGAHACNLSTGDRLPAERGDRQLVVLLLDATWSGARKMLRLSPGLQRLPRIMFTPTAPSRYIIKQQPQAGCLSTLESVHELLTVLARTGLDRYEQPDQLIEIFHRMQDFQIRCAADPTRPGYRRKPYGDPASRSPARGSSGNRRENFLRQPSAGSTSATETKRTTP